MKNQILNGLKNIEESDKIAGNLPSGKFDSNKIDSLFRQTIQNDY